MVGSSIVRKLEENGYENIIKKSRTELDLLNQNEVEEFFKTEKPDYVFIAAAKVGGILANDKYRGQFLFENLVIQNNTIHSAFQNHVKKLVFLGSSCIYPKLAPQPLKEEYLLTGELEPTNEPYAIAKIAGIKLCENYFKQYGVDFISVMPTNLYGFNDNFNLETSHVLPALIRKFAEAKLKNIDRVEIWGTGLPRREFLYVDDLADACMYIMQKLSAVQLYKGMGVTHINIGTGEDISIKDLAIMISDIIGFKGKFYFNANKPDGTPRKLLDVTRINDFGWKYKISLDEGIKKTYNWYINNCIL